MAALRYQHLNTSTVYNHLLSLIEALKKLFGGHAYHVLASQILTRQLVHPPTLGVAQKVRRHSA